MDRRELLIGGAALGGLALFAGADDEQQKPKVCPDGHCPPHLHPAPQPAPDLPIKAYTGVVLDLPPEMRTKNWGGGSCVHASTVNLLKWMGQHEMADW